MLAAIMRPVAFMRQEVGGTTLRRIAPLLRSLAFHWRSILRRTCFIAITGSLGKTTAKECLGAILSARGPTFVSRGNQNAGHLLLLNLLRVRPWHRYAVIETAAGRPGGLQEASRLVRPNLALIISVAQAHTSTLGRLDGIAREKLSLLDHLGPGASVIVDGDEPRLREAGTGRTFRVVRFGVETNLAEAQRSSPPPPGKASNRHQLDMVAEDISAVWPECLRFTATTAKDQIPVTTRLVGSHWTPAVTAALLAAQVLGVPLHEAAAVVSAVEPQPARMQPVSLPPGITVLRDDYNGAPASWEAAFQVMAEARTRRRVLVAGDYSDHWLGPRQRLQRMGLAAARWADVAVFVGPNSHYACKGALAGGMVSDAVWAGASWEGAATWLKARLQPGDLMLLKGRIHEHLARLLFALIGPVGCHRQICHRRYLCDECWNLGVPTSRLKSGEIRFMTGPASGLPLPSFSAVSGRHLTPGSGTVPDRRPQ
jgi:UDP-N-acetylmuramoyl-tripeptide--D-alanyl-D-alanine ligase